MSDGRGVEVAELIGKTLTDVVGVKGSDEILFTCVGGDQYKMYHQEDCCERVWVEDIVGDLADLIDSPVLYASEETNTTDAPAENANDSYTWTFYRLATLKGYVVIRWFGTSNGYYSESVGFVKL